jgi:tetratricopeptide (TPR) repeat protein
MVLVRGVVVVAALFVAAETSQAQVAPKMPEQVKHCTNDEGTFDDEDSIRNCTAIFQAAGATQDERYGALMLRSAARLRSKAYDSALSDVDKALTLAMTARDMAEVYLQRAYVLSGQKKDTEAAAELERSIKADPKFADALLVRAQLRSGKGEYRGALADYDQVNLLGGRNPDALNEACWIRAANLNTELAKALGDCNRAVEFAPKSASYLDSRGLVNLRLQELDAAFKDYDAAVKLAPKNASALYGRAVAAMAMGRPGDADIAAAKAINPKIADNYAAIGLAAGTVKGLVAVTGPLAQPTAYNWEPPELARQAKDCGYDKYLDASSYALAHRQGNTQAQTDASFVKRNAENASTQAFCLRRLKRQFPGARQMLEQAALNSPADLDAAYRLGRGEFLANPVKFMWTGDPAMKDYSASAMRADLAKVRAFKTLEQVCGTFDYAMPEVDNSVLHSRNTERKAYGKCAENYRDTVHDQVPGSIEYQFSSARDELDSFTPYVCARYRLAGCIPDSRWNEFDSIASKSNLALIKRIDDLKRSEYGAASDAVERTNQWVEDVNAMVERYNQR